MIFQSQRYCLPAAVSLVALPVVLAGLVKALSARCAGRTILALYLVPSLIIALVYRIPWTFSVHIICVYHTFALFLWVLVLKNARSVVNTFALTAIALEGVICVLFSDVRFNPVRGIQLSQLTSGSLTCLSIYFGLLLVILGAAYLEIRRLPVEIRAEGPEVPRGFFHSCWFVVSRKLFVGVLVIALTIAGYSLYCLRFY